MKLRSFLKEMDKEINEAGVKELGPAVKSAVKTGVKAVGQKLKGLVSKLEDGWQRFVSFIGELKNGKSALFSKQGKKISKDYESIERIAGNIPMADSGKRLAALNAAGKEQAWIDLSKKVPVMWIDDRPSKAVAKESIDLSSLVPLFETIAEAKFDPSEPYSAAALFPGPGQVPEPEAEAEYTKQAAMLPKGGAADVEDLPWMIGPKQLRESIIPKFLNYGKALIADVQAGRTAAERPSMALFGPQGTGKSAIVQAIFGSKYKYEVMVLPTSSIPKEAISGIPQAIKEKDGKSYLEMTAITGGKSKEGRLMPPNKLKKEPGYKDKFVLFLDEYNRADESIFNALMTMFSAGKIGEHYELPDRTLIIVAGNQRDSQAAGQVDMGVLPLDPAQQKRLKWNFYLNYDFREWLHVHSTNLGSFNYNTQDDVDDKDVPEVYRAWLKKRMGKNDYISLNVPPVLPILRTAIQQSVLTKHRTGNVPLDDPKIWAAPAEEFTMKFSDMEEVEEAPTRKADYSTFSALDTLMKSKVVHDYLREVEPGSEQAKYWEKYGKKAFPEIKDPIEAGIAGVMFSDAKQSEHADLAPLIIRGPKGKQVSTKLKTFYRQSQVEMRPEAAVFHGLGHYEKVQKMSAVDLNLLGFGLPGVIAAAKDAEAVRNVVKLELNQKKVSKELKDYILTTIKKSTSALYTYVGRNIILYAGSKNASPESLTGLFIAAESKLTNMTADRVEKYIKGGMSESEAKNKAAEEATEFYAPIHHLIGVLLQMAEEPPEDIYPKNVAAVKKGQMAVKASTESGLNTIGKLAKELGKDPQATADAFRKDYGVPVIIKQIMKLAKDSKVKTKVATSYFTSFLVGVQLGIQRARSTQVQAKKPEPTAGEQETKEEEGLYTGRNSVLVEMNIPESTMKEMLDLAGV